MERLVGEYAFIAEKVGYSTNTIASNLGVPSSSS
jgi:hypothetical protein